MSPPRVWLTARRVLAQVRHDPRTIGLLLAVPCLLIGLMAWLFSSTPVFDRVGPAMLALFPFIVMFLVCSVSTLRERRGGTLERLLTMPLAKLDFLLGYALAFGLLALVQAAVAVGFAIWVCGLYIAGSIWLLLAVAVANGILGTAIGLLTSAFAGSEFQAIQFMPAVVFPQFLLGGVLLTRDRMPATLRVISDWLPLSHAIDALNAVASASQGAGYVGGKLLIIAAFAVGAVALGAATLRRKTG